MFAILATLAAEAGQKIGSSVAGDIGGLFGESSADKDRADRLAFIAGAVRAGSVLAARAILGGLTPNGVGAASERAAWQQVYQHLLMSNPAVMAQAQAAGAFWYYGADQGDHPLSPQLRRDITTDLAQMGYQYPTQGQYTATPLGSINAATSNNASGTTSYPPGVTTLPAMTTTANAPHAAGTNWLMWGGVALLVVVLALILRRR